MKDIINVEDAFKMGTNNIGWMNSDFTSHFGKEKFILRSTPTFQKLTKGMNDVAIESELKPGLCELGDILSFIKNAPQECKDGYANLFYTKDFVVYVRWYALDGKWHVNAWHRDDDDWSQGDRVFSPATENFNDTPSVSEPLNLGSDISEEVRNLAIKIVKQSGYMIIKGDLI